jgi:hypothetical protein
MPTGDHQFTTDDGQVLLLGGPPIVVRNPQSKKPGSEVSLVSGPGEYDVLVVDGVQKPLPFPTTSLMPGANFGDMLIPWDFEDGAYDQFPDFKGPSNGASGSKKPPPALYKGGSSSQYVTKLQISLLALGFLFII